MTDREIVVGDVLQFNAHMLASIPADGILISGDNVKIDEAALTGEPEPIEKKAKCVLHARWLHARGRVLPWSRQSRETMLRWGCARSAGGAGVYKGLNGRARRATNHRRACLHASPARLPDANPHHGHGRVAVLPCRCVIVVLLRQVRRGGDALHQVGCAGGGGVKYRPGGCFPCFPCLPCFRLHRHHHVLCPTW